MKLNASYIQSDSTRRGGARGGAWKILKSAFSKKITVITVISHKIMTGGDKVGSLFLKYNLHT